MELMWICNGCETYGTFSVKKGTKVREANAKAEELHRKDSPSCTKKVNDGILVVNSFQGRDIVETSQFIAP